MKKEDANENNEIIIFYSMFKSFHKKSLLILLKFLTCIQTIAFISYFFLQFFSNSIKFSTIFIFYYQIYYMLFKFSFQRLIRLNS